MSSLSGPMGSKDPRPTPAPTPVSTPKVDPAPSPLVPESDAPKIAAFTHLHDYLTYARDIGGSDLHINVASPPVIRKYGRLAPLPRTPFTAAETEGLLFKILTDEQRQRIHTELALDFRYIIPNQGVYRSCIVKQRMGWDGSFRIVQSRVPSFTEWGPGVRHDPYDLGGAYDRSDPRCVPARRAAPSAQHDLGVHQRDCVPATHPAQRRQGTRPGDGNLAEHAGGRQSHPRTQVVPDPLDHSDVATAGNDPARQLVDGSRDPGGHRRYRSVLCRRQEGAVPQVGPTH